MLAAVVMWTGLCVFSVLCGLARGNCFIWPGLEGDVLPYGDGTITGYTAGSTLTIECDTDYTLHGASEYTCDGETAEWISADGQWSTESGVWNPYNDPYCKPDSIPDYCRVLPPYPKLNTLYSEELENSFSPPGTVVSFSCHAGFTLIAASMETTCVTGEWNVPQPSCIKAVVCLHTPQVLFGVAYTNGDDIGAVMTFSCADDRKLIGPSTLSCRADGEWIDERNNWGTQDGEWIYSNKEWNVRLQPFCSQYLEDTYCSAFSGLQHMSVQYSVKYGDYIMPQSLAKFICDVGYGMVDQGAGMMQMCQVNGEWDGTTPQCTEHSIAAPGDNAMSDTSNNTESGGPPNATDTGNSSDTNDAGNKKDGSSVANDGKSGGATFHILSLSTVMTVMMMMSLAAANV